MTGTSDDGDVAEEMRDLTEGRGPGRVIDAVGMEAHGAPVAEARAEGGRVAARRRSAQALIERSGIDRLAALYDGDRHGAPRRHDLDHRRVRRRCRPDADARACSTRGSRSAWARRNVKRWVDDILPLLTDEDDPLGADDFATHGCRSSEAPHGYEMFQKKEDGAIKILLEP